jgi:hypothetical protein
VEQSVEEAIGLTLAAYTSPDNDRQAAFAARKCNYDSKATFHGPSMWDAIQKPVRAASNCHWEINVNGYRALNC